MFWALTDYENVKSSSCDRLGTLLHVPSLATKKDWGSSKSGLSLTAFSESDIRISFRLIWITLFKCKKIVLTVSVALPPLLDSSMDVKIMIHYSSPNLPFLCNLEPLCTLRPPCCYEGKWSCRFIVRSIIASSLKPPFELILYFL